MLAFETRLYTAAGTRVPCPRAWVLSRDFILTERGGCDTFTLDLVAAYEDVEITALLGAMPASNWRVEFWWGSACVYRGWVEQVERSLQDTPSLTLTGCGLMGRCGTLLVDSAIVKAGGADVSEFFAQLAHRYLLPALPGLTVSIDTPIGYTLERAEFFDTDLRAAFDKLADASMRGLLWGFAVDPTGGGNVLYVRAMPIAVTLEDYRFRAGREVTYLAQPEDLAGVVNAIKLVGGNAGAAGNTVYNSRFAQALLPGETVAGNLLIDPSFETGTVWHHNASDPWVETGDARKRPSERWSGAYARSGNYVAILGSVAGSSVAQTVDVSAQLLVGADTPFLFLLNTALWVAGSATVGVKVEVLNAALAVLATPINGSFGVTWRSYQEHREVFHVAAALTTAKYIKVTVTWTAGTTGILLDDLWLFRGDKTSQDGWVLYDTDAKKLVTDVPVDWSCNASPLYGSSCVRIDTTGKVLSYGGRKVTLIPTNDHGSPFRKYTAFALYFWLRSSTAMTVSLGLYVDDPGGSVKHWLPMSGNTVVTNGLGTWQRIKAVIVTEGNEHATGLRAALAVCSAGVLDVDCCMLREDGVAGDDEFMPGETCEWVFRGDNATPAVALPTTGAGALSAAAQASISTYGLREKVVDAEEITTLKQARAYAAGWLNRYASPVRTGQVSIDPADTLVCQVDTSTDALATTGLVRVDGLTVPLISYPTRVQYTMAEHGGERCDLDLDNRRPDPALLLLYALGGKKGRGGGGGHRGGSNLVSTPGNSVPTGDPGSSTLPVLAQYGPSEPGVYARTWDANPDTLAGGTRTLTLYASDGVTPKAPIPGTLVRVWVGKNYHIPIKEWSISDYTITFAAGCHPILDQVVTVEFTPGG
ncbi:MAG TPA: hypothetical protein VGN26_03870 [Armatimonadota bacterium]|jgi:hypothetical protein